MDAPEFIVVPLHVQHRIASVLASLPTLTKHDVPLEDSCPICLVPFAHILEEHELAEGTNSKAHELTSGITRLPGCGHAFCKKDMFEWIRGCHGTCPACRDIFADIEPAFEEDYESSDGDYVPGEDDEDEDEDGFDVDVDAYTDMDDDFEADPMDLDVLDAFGGDIAADVDYWLEHGSFADGAAPLEAPAVHPRLFTRPFRRRDGGLENWGLSDGEGSESVSEVELALAEPSEQESSAPVGHVEAAIQEDSNAPSEYTHGLSGSRSNSEVPK